MATKTAAQQRAEAKMAYNAFVAACPSRQLLDSISDKWVTLVLASLSGGPKRYSELARQLAGVSQKMLTQTLRKLERDGMITREVTPSVPVRVDYELTDLGASLHAVVLQFKTWAEAHMDDVTAARDTYDAEDRATA